METFIKTFSDKDWRNVVKGWDPLKVVDAAEKVTDVLKLEEDWDDNDEALSQGNSKALNAIFNGVDKNIFKLIKNCKHVKVA